MDWNSITKELQAKLDSGAVKTRVQGGTELQYIEGWHAIAEANRIFGFGNWDRISNVSLIKEVEGKDRRGNLQWRVSYLGKCTISVGNTKRDGHGYGSGIAADLGQAHEGAIKEAETDAMKRAFIGCLLLKSPRSGLWLSLVFPCLKNDLQVFYSNNYSKVLVLLQVAYKLRQSGP